MVRNSRCSKRQQRGIGEMELPGASNEMFEVPIIKEKLLKHCPLCARVYNDGMNRQCQEKCGHVKCRSCFVREDDGCSQCVEDARLKSLTERSLGFGTETAVSNSYASLSSIEGPNIEGQSLLLLKESGSLLRDEEAGTSQVVPLTNDTSNSKESCQPTIDFSTKLEIAVPTVNHIIYSSDLNCQPEFGLADYALFEDLIMNNDYSNGFQNQGNYNSSLSEITSDNKVESFSDVKGKKKGKPVVIYDHITVFPGHSGHPTMYECNVCRKRFKTKACIKYHEFCQKGDKAYNCDLCGESFIAKSPLERHLRTHIGERPYLCPQCGKGFNQRGNVTRHMRTHTGEKPFICEKCNRQFTTKQGLKAHFLLHTEEKHFVCEVCDKRFARKAYLKKHVSIHTRRTGKRPFKCTRSYQEKKDDDQNSKATSPVQTAQSVVELRKERSEFRAECLSLPSADGEIKRISQGEESDPYVTTDDSNDEICSTSSDSSVYVPDNNIEKISCPAEFYYKILAPDVARSPPPPPPPPPKRTVINFGKITVSVEFVTSKSLDMQRK